MCNLKSNKNLKEILAYKKTIVSIPKKEIEFVLFPSTLYLPFFYDAPYRIGSQNISIYESGSHTGEILASQLKSVNISYVLVNHYEQKDSKEQIIFKIKNATKEKIKVVFCIGEENRQTMDETIEEMKREIHKIFTDLTQKEMENIIIAYEPCWAINKEYNINTKTIDNIAKKLKNEIEKRYNIAPPILYGAGINNKNIKELAKLDNIDGYLLGNFANNPENIYKVFDIF